MPAVPYSDPWNESYDHRISALLKGDTTVAYIYEAPAKNTFRYRVYNMVQALTRSSSGVSASYFSTQECDQISQALDDIDVLVISRSRYSGDLNRLITRARNRGKKVFFDIDDLIFDPDYTHLIVQTLDLPRTEETWNHWFALIARIRASIQLCDAVITTNEFLAEKLRSYFAKPTFVIPNFMNEQQLEISRQIFEKKKASNWKRDDSITLGYFSGTQTHNRDFEVAANALADLFKGDGRIKLRIGGYLSISGPLEEFSSRIELLPLRDFVNLQTAVGEVDVNLVPLQDNVFSNCKSELKYFEAAVVGTITIASPIFSYARAIRDGQNGFLAESYAWSSKFEEVLQTMDKYCEIAESAQEDAQHRYSWSNQAGLIEQTLASSL
jgi:glycosyltransferase involved in cell wall biosynthesis